MDRNPGIRLYLDKRTSPGVRLECFIEVLKRGAGAEEEPDWEREKLLVRDRDVNLHAEPFAEASGRQLRRSREPCPIPAHSYPLLCPWRHITAQCSLFAAPKLIIISQRPQWLPAFISVYTWFMEWSLLDPGWKKGGTSFVMPCKQRCLIKTRDRFI